MNFKPVKFIDEVTVVGMGIDPRTFLNLAMKSDGTDETGTRMSKARLYFTETCGVVVDDDVVGLDVGLDVGVVTV